MQFMWFSTRTIDGLLFLTSSGLVTELKINWLCISIQIEGVSRGLFAHAGKIMTDRWWWLRLDIQRCKFYLNSPSYHSPHLFMFSKNSFREVMVVPGGFILQPTSYQLRTTLVFHEYSLCTPHVLSWLASWIKIALQYEREDFSLAHQVGKIRNLIAN